MYFNKTDLNLLDEITENNILPIYTIVNIIDSKINIVNVCSYRYVHLLSLPLGCSSSGAASVGPLIAHRRHSCSNGVTCCSLILHMKKTFSNVFIQ